MFARPAHARIAVAFAVIAFAASPTVGTAMAQDVPDSIDDPMEAVLPPAAPTQADEIVVAIPAKRETVPVATASHASRSSVGSLPFTGTDPRQIALLLVVGAVVACGGVVCVSWARAVDASIR